MDKDYLLEKWLKGDLTDAEKEAFSKLDDAQFNQYIIDAAQHFKVSNFSEVDSFQDFKQRYNLHRTPVKKLSWLHPLLKIACVIVVSLGIYFTFFFNRLTHFETMASEKTTIELPDHSKVELNALTEVWFNAENWNKKRALELEGEAFFKVATGSVFDVKTHDGIVTVVGTQFNVKQRDHYFEVKCFEGIVKVTSDTITRQLYAGDVFRILHGTFSETKTTVPSPKWTHNISNFEAVPFKEILAELERQYNIEVTFKGIDANRLFTGGFVHDKLENALISITQPMNLTFELRSSNLVIIHGKEN
ncbi:FecR family protein [Flavivirga rizhaonensis]|uniref:FecR family protein n=1 Tax=Flavivirga rizhaonensis TaxID=2559571 RepID=A0A4S1DYS2_9FLAO|nr:FecR family protein [Flavivirga rizhaonensis]TGV02718.1 FecR family protein [Flavivirga rizhaonensis]